MKRVNKKDLARLVAAQLNLTLETVESVMNTEREAMQQLLQNGYSIKDGKNWVLSLEKKAEYRGYNGIHKEHYIVPEHIVLKFSPLSATKESLRILNELDTDDEELN